MIAILATYLVVGLVIVAFGRRLGRVAFLVGVVPLLVTVGWVVARFADLVDGEVFSSRLTWVGPLDLVIDLRVDGLAATMTLIVAAVGVLVFWYAHGYFGEVPRGLRPRTPSPSGELALAPPDGSARSAPLTADRMPDVGRLAGLLVLFAGAMVGLVQSDNVYVFYVFWELTSVTSFLLIGIHHTDSSARAAAVHAFLVTSAGGLAMLAGFVLIDIETGVSELSRLASVPTPSGTAVTVAMVLLLLGAFTKSAQYPFHAWLPAAMAAPTPVSAYLHSATMVTAGVYLVARLAPTFATVTPWRPIVFAVGSVTILAGGVQALRQHDAKLMLAYGTISQLGFMVVLFGAGTAATATAGWLLLGAQALFKAALFMVVGIVDHQTGTRDLRRLPPLGRSWWWVEGTTIVAAASMAGVPLTAGFIAKEADFGSLADARFGGHWPLVGVVVAGSVLTAAYSATFYWGTFVAARRRARARAGADATRPPISSPISSPIPPPSWRFGLPAVLLASGCLALGVMPSVENSLAFVAVRGLYATATSPTFAIWHGVNLELVLSVVALGGGLLLFLLARDGRLDRLPRLPVPSGERAYFATLRSVTSASHRITGIVQNGSLPVYVGVILATALALPAWVLVTEWHWTRWPDVVDRAGDVPIVGFLVVAALGAALVRRRFAAALFLGATGYAMAALFVTYGAPDLALTQVAVETLSTVVFVLVLRRLPKRFERQSSSRRRVVRLVIAAFVGAVVFVFAIAASSTTLPASVSEEIVARSVPDAHGRNVVNVILVDFRGLDTLGEITVLAVASIGAVALARVGRRAARERGEPDPIDETAEPEAGEQDPIRRLAFVDVSVQVIFLTVLMASLWLLFAGHNQPGGGFVAGLLAGSAITLRYIAGGIGEVRARSRFRPWTVLGAGLLTSTVTATLPLLTGSPVLTVASHAVSVPGIGTVTLSSALAFDVGVYLTVLGMVLMAFEAFGEASSEASSEMASEVGP